MNREILFRGFHPCEDGDTTIYVEGEAVKGRWVEGDLIHDYFKIGDTCICVDRKWYEIKQVLPFTVGQYTTKDDTHKNKAFVGDVVRHSGDYHTVYGIIQFGEMPDVSGVFKNVGYFIEWQNDGANMWGDWWRSDLGFWLADKRYEVIGTIWDKENDGNV